MLQHPERSVVIFACNTIGKDFSTGLTNIVPEIERDMVVGRPGGGIDVRRLPQSLALPPAISPHADPGSAELHCSGGAVL